MPLDGSNYFQDRLPKPKTDALKAVLVRLLSDLIDLRDMGSAPRSLDEQIIDLQRVLRDCGAQ